MSARGPTSNRERVFATESMRTWDAVMTAVEGAPAKVKLVAFRLGRERTMVPMLEIIVSHCPMY